MGAKIVVQNTLTFRLKVYFHFIEFQSKLVTKIVPNN